jgi:hypothetical protein
MWTSDTFWFDGGAVHKKFRPATTGVTDTPAKAVIATGATMCRLTISTSGPSSANACEMISTSGPSSGTEDGSDGMTAEAANDTADSLVAVRAVTAYSYVAPAAGVSVADVETDDLIAPPHTLAPASRR